MAACAARLDLILLALLVGLSLFFRLWGLDWDDGGLYHPDERAILLRVSEMTFPFRDLGSLFSVESAWNPGWFPYGSLPLYLLKAAGYLAPPVFENPPLIELAQAGRVVSALLDTLTVVLVYLIGRRLFGRWEGLLAATMIGLAVLHIQQSHFFVSDLMLGTFIMGGLYFLSKAALSPGERRGTYKRFAIAALFFGMALASKFSALPFAFVFVVAAALWALPEHRREPVLFAIGAVALVGMAVGFSQPVFWVLGVAGALGLLAWAGSRLLRAAEEDPDFVPRLLHAAKLLLLSAGVTVVIFTILQPYAWIDYRTYVGDIGNEGEMVRRIADLPYTRQYIETTPYLYHVQQLALWGVGLPVGILMWAGFAFSIAVALRRRDPRHLLMLAWVAPYFATVGAFDVKFLRYMLPITPLLAVMSASLVSEVLTVLRERRLPDLRFVRALRPSYVYVPLAAALLLTLLYAVSYMRVYDGPHPATAAANWIRDQSTSRDTAIVKEHWEEGLGGVRNGLYGYRISELEIYNPDNPVKRDGMARLLADADYLVFYSNRMYGTIPRLPERYPATSDYYHALFRGELGFELAHFETAYPNLFGVSLKHDTFGRPGLPEPPALRDYKQNAVDLNLGFADESYSVYDHPLVLVFEKTLDGTLSEQLEFYRANLPWGPPTAQSIGSELLLLSDDDARTQQEGGTWSDIFSRDLFVNKIPGVVWYLAAQLAFLLALPITLMVFRRLPDRGYFLGKMFGVLLAAYIPWLLASLHWLSFSRLSVLVGLLLLAAVSALILWRKDREIFAFLREKWRVIVAGEVLFLVAFAGMFAVRMWNPDLWDLYLGGEKPMDFAYFNAVLKSTYMPPYDPWFAGGQLNYYYFGFFMGAAFTKFTGVLPSISITLIVPLFFALTAAAAFSVVYNLAALVKRRLDENGGPRLPSPIFAGALAALFVTVLGNLDGAAQLLQGLGRVLRNQDFGTFDFWRSSRMLGPEGDHGITEFPFFTFLFADPHAHLFVIPLTILAIGLALAFIVGSRGPGGRLGVMSWPAYIALGLTLGAIQATNSWDAPTYLLIGGAAILIAEYAARREVTPGLIALAAVKTVGLYVIGYLFFLPFQQSYESFLPYTDAIARTGNQAVLWRYLGIHGFFILVIMGLPLLAPPAPPAAKGRGRRPLSRPARPAPRERSRPLARPRRRGPRKTAVASDRPGYWPWLLAAAALRRRGGPPLDRRHGHDRLPWRPALGARPAGLARRPLRRHGRAGGTFRLSPHRHAIGHRHRRRHLGAQHLDGPHEHRLQALPPGLGADGPRLRLHPLAHAVRPGVWERAPWTLGGPRRTDMAEPRARASGGGARLSHPWHRKPVGKALVTHPSDAGWHDVHERSLLVRLRHGDMVAAASRARSAGVDAGHHPGLAGRRRGARTALPLTAEPGCHLHRPARGAGLGVAPAAAALRPLRRRTLPARAAGRRPAKASRRRALLQHDPPRRGPGLPRQIRRPLHLRWRPRAARPPGRGVGEVRADGRRRRPRGGLPQRGGGHLSSDAVTARA